MNEQTDKLLVEAGAYFGGDGVVYDNFDPKKFAALVAVAEREECAREVEEFARKWWSIHCHSNKHAETTRKAHDDFCALQAAIRRRGKTE
jgi:hypothetical protein